jgi:hypothetical protein
MVLGSSLAGYGRLPPYGVDNMNCSNPTEQNREDWQDEEGRNTHEQSDLGPMPLAASFRLLAMTQ